MPLSVDNAIDPPGGRGTFLLQSSVTFLGGHFDAPPDLSAPDINTMTDIPLFLSGAKRRKVFLLRKYITKTFFTDTLPYFFQKSAERGWGL